MKYDLDAYVDEPDPELVQYVQAMERAAGGSAGTGLLEDFTQAQAALQRQFLELDVIIEKFNDWLEVTGYEEWLDDPASHMAGSKGAIGSLISKLKRAG
jgi:hypothetical protein